MTKKKVSHHVVGKSPNELEHAKKTIKMLEKEMASLKNAYTKELAILIEEAYMAGYSDAIIDFDKKAEAMEKYLHKALKEFEKSYQNFALKEVTSKKGKKASSKKK